MSDGCRWPGTYFGLLREERELLKAVARGVARGLVVIEGENGYSTDIREKLARLEHAEQVALKVGRDRGGST